MPREPQEEDGLFGPSPIGPRMIRTPTTPERYVHRPRLHALLDELVRSPITLVVAPAGAGKTSLLVDWLSERQQQPVAWASLDESEREGPLWSTVAAALESCLPDLRDDASSAVHPRRTIDAVDVLLAAVESVTRPSRTILVLDDLPVFDDDNTTASLRLFLRSLPPWLHVVISARRMPHLPMDRLRSHGAVAELQFSDLRFSPDEARAMLTGLVPGLPPDAVARIAAESDGWAAGIQLAALVARSRLARRQDVLELGETKLLISDFVWHEVLAVERPEVIDVLMDTSVVARVGPGLIQSLTSQAEPESLLNEAAEHSLFVARLDTAGWVEVHRLVRDVLSAEAERREPGRVAAQHARAARWFDEAGDVTAALDHWLLAGRPREALSLLAGKAIALLYDSGAEETIAHTLARIPTALAVSEPDAHVEYAWCLLLTDRQRFLEAVDQLRAWTDSDVSRSAAFQNRVTMLESIAATITGDWSAGCRLAERALNGFGDTAQVDWLGRFGWNMLARGVALSGYWDDAMPHVEHARVGSSSEPNRRLAFETTRALGHALAGRPAKALELAQHVRAVDPFPERSILRAERAAAEAIAYRELGDRSRAEAALVPLAEAEIGPVTYVHVLAKFEMTCARLDSGDVPAARRAVDDLAQTVRADFGGPDGQDLLARAGTLVALAERDTDNARQWADSVEHPFWQAASLARVHLVEGNQVAARGVLDLAEPRSPRQEVVRDVLAARAAGALDDAAKSLVAVVEQATTTGLLQTVASEGPEVIDRLERMAWLAPKTWLDRLRRAASRTETKGSQAPRTDVPLTTRELEILRMLPSRLTVPEIAGELSISVNTTKFHLKSVYRKLGIGSREEAAHVARALRALRPPH